MPRLLIVDDHPLVRRGIVAVLQRTFPDSVFVEASDGEEAVQAIEDAAWDMVILDFSLPGHNGLEVLKAIKERRQRLPVLMLSGHPEDQIAVSALRAGASGYLIKGSTSEVLLAAVRRILAGGKYISEGLSESLVADLNRDYSKPLHENLSKREYDVMVRIGSGKTVSEIAEEMALSAKTISTYRARMLEKMHFRSNADISQYCLREQLVEIGHQ